MNATGPVARQLICCVICRSPEEAGALTGIGLTSIRQAAASGALKARKHGTRTIILRDDLKEWLQAMPVIGRKMLG